MSGEAGLPNYFRGGGLLVSVEVGRAAVPLDGNVRVREGESVLPHGPEHALPGEAAQAALP